jgi:hypothetical protein
MKKISSLMLFTLLFVASSCLNQEDGQYIPGVLGPKLNVQDGKVLLSIELENVSMDLGVTLPISNKLKNSTVSIMPAMRDDGTMGGTLIRASVDISDVNSDHFKVVPSQTLPDGRAFPYMVSGELPALAFHVPKAKNATFYVSKKVFGIFVPIKLPDDFIGSIHYRLKVNGKSYGVVSLINQDGSGEGAGVLALLTLDEVRNSKGLRKLMKLSKKNKSRVY